MHCRHRGVYGTQKDLPNSQSPFPWPKAVFRTAQSWPDIYHLTCSNNSSKVAASWCSWAVRSGTSLLLPLDLPWEDGFRSRFGDPNMSVYQQAVCFPLTGAQFGGRHAGASCSQGHGSPAGPISESRPLPGLTLSWCITSWLFLTWQAGHQALPSVVALNLPEDFHGFPQFSLFCTKHTPFFLFSSCRWYWDNTSCVQ